MRDQSPARRPALTRAEPKRSHSRGVRRRRDMSTLASHHETDEATIRQQLGQIIDSLRAKDLEALKGVYAPDVVSFDVEAPLQHLGIAAKLKNWEKVFTIFCEVRYELRDLSLTVDNEVAFGHGFGRVSGTLQNGQQTSGMWVRATFCFQKIDGAWLIVHDQASVPFDLATGRGVTDLEP